MYLNKAILMGFLGADAVVRNGPREQFTTLSLATKKSRKNKETGKYEEVRTDWHSLIVFGDLGKFAAKLKKGAHIQVEGEIQHSEYKTVMTATIRVYSILTLDRAENAAAEDEFDETPAEEVAE